MMLSSTLQKIFLQHPTKLDLNFFQYSGEFIKL